MNKTPGQTNAGPTSVVADAGSNSAHDRAAATFRGDEAHDRLEVAFRADHTVAASQELAHILANRTRAVLPAGSTLRTAECRSAFCRIETAHVSLDEFIVFVDHAFLGNGRPVTDSPVYAGVLGEFRSGEPVIAVAYVVLLDSSAQAKVASRGLPDRA